MNWRNSVILKKSLRYGIAPIRLILRYFEPNNPLYLPLPPPVVINSFPKSGTHLLLQIIQVLPGLRDWGLFLASTPSFSFKETDHRAMAKKLLKIANGELVLAHMFYSKEVHDAFLSRSTVNYFIYRDPREVVVSEAYYLTYINKWHRLHKVFNSLPDMNSRILFSIQGSNNNSNFDYPDINQRFNRYKPWLNQTNFLSLRFEDLVSSKKNESIHRIMQFYIDQTDDKLEVEKLVKDAIVNINPNKSHTYRLGKPNTWKNEFTPAHKEVFKKIAGQLLIDLNYELDYSW